MSSYEKQMQWKKAASIKATKHKEERESEQAYSFAPVFYTQSLKSSKDRHSEREIHSTPGAQAAQSHSSGRHRTENHGRSSQQQSDQHRHREAALHSPVGAASVNSQGDHSQYSEASPGDDRDYGGSYAEIHREEHQQQRRHEHPHRSRPSRREADPAVSDEHSHSAGEGGRDSRQGQGQRQERDVPSSSGAVAMLPQDGYRRGLQPAPTSNSRQHQHQQRRHKHRHHHHQDNRSRSSSRSSAGRNGSQSSEGRDEAEEPLVELLERERRQWREEREQLIHCIHLQQLELTQRSTAAHERAADIAKEFARAIECFQERLEAVEGNVQREIMSIKSIAEALLHTAQGSPTGNVPPPPPPPITTGAGAGAGALLPIRLT